MIERLRVQVPAGDFSSQELTFCPDSPTVSVPHCVTTVACKQPQQFCQKRRWQVTPIYVYTLDPMKLEWADCCPGISVGT